MKVEVGRFSDGRLKMCKTYTTEDSNFRAEVNRISIVPRTEEVKLERDVLEAIGLWNVMFMFPELREQVKELLARLRGRGISDIML